MWQYQKTLQYPVKIKNANPKLASFIISQYGGAYCKILVVKPTSQYGCHTVKYVPTQLCMDPRRQY